MARHLIEELQQRGLIAQATDLQALTERLTQGPITLYCGFDPTADSLHIGHLVTLLCLKRFQQAGHKPIILVGGATGLIGDPTFKATERKLNSQSIVQTWVEKIARQVSPFVDFDQHKSNAAMLANNQDWFGSMKVLSFLRDIGKHFSVNAMINKEAIRQRLNRNDSGISFTEFSYSLFQSYDFAVLNERYGVELQIGGSDQWGNITAGIELTRRLYQKQVYGLTVPLITKADGTKFGKTESHTVWLDANKTSPYTFYQFWLNSADADVYRFLGLFTFLTIEDIENIAAEDSASGQPPRAQQILAQEITRIVHGETGLAAALRITHSLFSGTLADLTTDDFAQLAQDGLPCLQLAGDITLPQALVAAGFSPSNAQARTLIESNAIAINGQKCADSHYAFKPSDRLYQRYTLLKRGKKHYCLICWD